MSNQNITVNQNMIINHVERYKKLYNEQFGENPTSWFSFLRWVSSFTFAGNFNSEDIKLAERLLKA